MMQVMDHQQYFSKHLPDSQKMMYISSCVFSASVASTEILMSDPSLKMDMSPLVADCECYTCRKHTRAYIHHLLAVREMLGKVLLMIHNLHHYTVFFQSIQEAIKQDRLEDLRKALDQKG
jgi:queuine tRNA-ribosyltransferase subunit QTRTD1